MPLSRSSKITLFLAIDVVFFIVEITIGYIVGSLALVADSFHMLNDVMGLLVALYAIRLSKSEASPRYSYGWHRAEIVAALINGVFLLALCFSIVMEAIQRFFHTPEITSPKLVVVVGALGLGSNLFGLFLFHENANSNPPKVKPKDSNGTAAAEPIPITPSHIDPENIPPTSEESHSFDHLHGLPAAKRASIMQIAQDIVHGRSASPVSHKGRFSIANEGRGSFASVSEAPRRSTDTILGRGVSIRDSPQVQMHPMPAEPETRADSTNQVPPPMAVEDQSRQPMHEKQDAGRGSMNMRALFLHVMGDALGNLGVITTGLIIWLSTWKYRAYFDPVVSLVITVIIFSSAFPLVRSAAFILLQAAPAKISIQDLREDIQKVEGVLSVHELHVWQLSETTIVASVHVCVTREREYMQIAQNIQIMLHEHGIHSSTIQPELDDTESGSSQNHMIPQCLISCPLGQKLRSG
ncbi:cation efflux protein [Hysterangium stoloniferum]|nr:cation efflux protein [Hysterangium stoloniferum]